MKEAIRQAFLLHQPAFDLEGYIVGCLGCDWEYEKSSDDDPDWPPFVEHVLATFTYET